MPRKFSVALLTVLALTLICTWAPWVHQGYAETRAVDTFNKAWAFVADGCGTNCKGCGAVSSWRVPFGVVVTVEYACGLIPADSPEYHQKSYAFVSALGTVHGLPAP